MEHHSTRAPLSYVAAQQRMFEAQKVDAFTCGIGERAAAYMDR